MQYCLEVHVTSSWYRSIVNWHISTTHLLMLLSLISGGQQMSFVRVLIPVPHPLEQSPHGSQEAQSQNLYLPSMQYPLGGAADEPWAAIVSTIVSPTIDAVTQIFIPKRLQVTRLFFTDTCTCTNLFGFRSNEPLRFYRVIFIWHVITWFSKRFFLCTAFEYYQWILFGHFCISTYST